MTAVDFQPLIQLVLDLAGAVLFAFATWATARFGHRIGLQADDVVRTYLDETLARAIQFGLQIAQTKAKSTVGPVELRDAAVAEAVTYAIQAVPDALTRFRITPERLANMIRARLPEA